MTRNGLKHMDYDDALINTELCFSILVSTADDLRKHNMNPARTCRPVIAQAHFPCTGSDVYEYRFHLRRRSPDGHRTCTAGLWETIQLLFHDAIILVKKARFHHDRK